MYNTQERLTDKAIDLYQIRYRDKFKSFKNNKKLTIKYKTLVDEKLLEEQDISCIDENSIILLERKGEVEEKKNNYSYSRTFYLTCHDKKGSEIHKNIPPSLSDAIAIDENEPTVDPGIDPPKISIGNTGWVSTNVQISVDSPNSNYSYEYYKSTEPATPSNTGFDPTKLGGPATSVTISPPAGVGTTYVWFRATKMENGVKKVSNWSNRVEAHIDNTTPVMDDIKSDDSIPSGSAHVSSFILMFNITSNSPAGVYYKVNNNVIPYDYYEVDFDTTATNTTFNVVACNVITNACSAQKQYKFVK